MLLRSLRAQRRRTWFLAAVTAATALAAAAACGIDAVATKDFPGPPDASETGTVVLPPKPDGDVPDGGRVDADADADARLGCLSDAGPLMVALPDSGTCIDITEVSNEQYDQFLAATGGKPDAGAIGKPLPASCAAVGSLQREPVNQDAGPKLHPVARISWCSAFAYCAWAGKRLCGKVATDRDASTGEWYGACSSAPAANLYPYGMAYVAGRCNDNNVSGGPVAVGSFAGCTTTGSGVRDLSGNVEEWIDSCDLGGNCAAAGSFYNNAPPDSTCHKSFDYPVALTDPAIGFRCCADQK